LTHTVDYIDIGGRSPIGSAIRIE